MFSKQKIDFQTKSKDDNKLITLIGMMGTGKSKIGYLLGRKLNINFYDTDKLIEKQYNTSIKTLFQLNGEKYFRKVEKEKIKQIVDKSLELEDRAVISIGGGAFIDSETRELLLRTTKVVWLNTPVSVLVNRIGDGYKRPMIKGDVKISINDILEKRIEYYSLCHHQLDTNNLNQEQIINKIIDIMHN